MEGRRGRLGQDDRRVEVPIVDLIAASTAEELCAINVHGDLVSRRHQLSVHRCVGRAGRRVAVDGGAGHARVEARETTRFPARAAPRHLVGFPPDRGPATRRLDPEAVL